MNKKDSIAKINPTMLTDLAMCQINLENPISFSRISYI